MADQSITYVYHFCGIQQEHVGAMAYIDGTVRTDKIVDTQERYSNLKKEIVETLSDSNDNPLTLISLSLLHTLTGETP